SRFDLDLVVLRDPDRAPLADAGVRLAGLDRDQDLIGAGDGERTDAEGRAHFHGLEPGAYVIHIDRVAGAGVVQVPGERPHTVVGPPGLRIAGHVLDPVGRPVAGALVLVHGNLLWPAPLARTDDAGAFDVDGLAPYLSLQGEAPGYLPSELAPVRAESLS